MTVTMVSASRGATQEAVEEVLAKRGFEVQKPEPATPKTPAEEPAHDAFASDEEFEAAHEEGQAKQETDAEEDEGEDEPQPARPKLSKFQKRLQKVTGRLQTELEKAQARIAELEKGGKKEKEPVEENPRPVRSKFATQEEYEDSLLEWGVTDRLAKKEAADAAREQREHAEQIQSTYKSSVEAFKDTVDDWDEVVANSDIPMHLSEQLAIMEQDNAAEIVYHLGKHPDYARKLAEMSPLGAVMEVGRLSAKLKAASGSAGIATGPAVSPKPKPKVPPPVRPVSTSATQPTLTTSGAKSLKDFRAAKAARRG